MKYDVEIEAEIHSYASLLVRIEAESAEKAKRRAVELAEDVDSPVGQVFVSIFRDEEPVSAYDYSVAALEARLAGTDEPDIECLVGKRIGEQP